MKTLLFFIRSYVQNLNFWKIFKLLFEYFFKTFLLSGLILGVYTFFPNTWELKATRIIAIGLLLFQILPHIKPFYFFVPRTAPMRDVHRLLLNFLLNIVFTLDFVVLFSLSHFIYFFLKISYSLANLVAYTFFIACLVLVTRLVFHYLNLKTKSILKILFYLGLVCLAMLQPMMSWILIGIIFTFIFYRFTEPFVAIEKSTFTSSHFALRIIVSNYSLLKYYIPPLLIKVAMFVVYHYYLKDRNNLGESLVPYLYLGLSTPILLINNVFNNFFAFFADFWFLSEKGSESVLRSLKNWIPIHFILLFIDAFVTFLLTFSLPNFQKFCESYIIGCLILYPLSLLIALYFPQKIPKNPFSPSNNPLVNIPGAIFIWIIAIVVHDEILKFWALLIVSSFLYCPLLFIFFKKYSEKKQNIYLNLFQ